MGFSQVPAKSLFVSELPISSVEPGSSGSETAIRPHAVGFRGQSSVQGRRLNENVWFIVTYGKSDMES